MLSIHVYISPADFDYSLIHFFGPFLNVKLKKNEILLYHFEKREDILFNRLEFQILPKVDSEQLIAELSEKWSAFISRKSFNFKKESTEISLFLGYPFGKLICSENVQNEDALTDSKGRISKTNIAILKALENQSEDEYLFKLLKITLVLLYCFGGYTYQELQTISDRLLKSISFDQKEIEILNENSYSFVKENIFFQKQKIPNILLELSIFTKGMKSMSKISRWKFSYGIIEEDHHSFVERITLFKTFTNQLGLTDAQAYFILKIINEQVSFQLV